MAEMYTSMSPYHYGMNSPMVYNDPTGMMSEAYNFGMSGSSGSAHDMYQRDAAISQSASGKARDVNESDIAGDGDNTKVSYAIYTFGHYLLNEKTGQVSEKVIEGSIPVFLIYKSRYEGVYNHHAYAFFKRGISNEMTYSPEEYLVNARSYQALKGMPLISGYHRDEIPYKSTAEGGANASTAYITIAQSVRHGGDYSAFLLAAKIKSGDKFLVNLINDKDGQYDPVPSPVFVPYTRPQQSLFLRAMERAKTMQFNSPFIFIPSVQALQWSMPYKIPIDAEIH